MTKVDDNLFPKLILVEGTAPSSPSAGDQTLFIDSADHKLKRKNSSGTVTTIEGGGGGAVASDTIWDAKGDLAVGTGADTASKLTVGSNGQTLVADSAQTTGTKWAAGPIGGTSLVFRYTVTGSDKLNIDTGVDTPDAGSNDFTNGDVLEIFFYSRTDETAAVSQIQFLINNDTTSGHYDEQRLGGQGSSTFATANNAGSDLFFDTSGASATANAFGSAHITIPNFMGTVGYKSAIVRAAAPDNSASHEMVISSQQLRSTSAITRVFFGARTSGKKLKVGSQLLIYKRLAA